MSLHLFLALVVLSNGYPVQGRLPPATVGCFGDSILAIGNVCSEVGSAIPVGYDESSAAISGETADQIYDRVVSEALTVCMGEPCGTYYVEGVINTLKDGAYSSMDPEEVAEIALNGLGPSVKGIMHTLDWLHSQVPSAEVLALGATPYGACDSATCPVLVDPGPRARAFNERFLEECAERPWLRCIDVYEEFEEPHSAEDPHTDELAESYRALDGIHLTALARALLGTRMSTMKTWR